MRATKGQRDWAARVEERADKDFVQTTLRRVEAHVDGLLARWTRTLNARVAVPCLSQSRSRFAELVNRVEVMVNLLDEAALATDDEARTRALVGAMDYGMLVRELAGGVVRESRFAPGTPGRKCPICGFGGRCYGYAAVLRRLGYGPDATHAHRECIAKATR